MCVVACLLLVFSVNGVAKAQNAAPTVAYAQFLKSTFLSVYSDGSAEVNQTATLSQNVSSISLPLLSAKIGNILTLDEKRSPLSYQLSGQNITIYTLGASWVGLSYETSALTTKQGPLWTLSFNSPFNMTLVLPDQATTLSLSGAPVSISTKNNRPTFVLNAGSWEVSYGLPIGGVITSTTGTSSGSSTQSASKSSSQGAAALPFSAWEVVIAAVVVIGAAVAVVARTRRKGIGGIRALRFGDAEMLRFIKEKGGRAIEAEIRERFSLPRTSAWRQAKRLERLGYVRISKMGSQNQVELLRQDFEQPVQF